MTLDEAKQEATDAMNAYPNSCPRINIYATNILFFADTIAELEAHNRQLLNDKDASPAVIAGYREYNSRLIKENKELSANAAFFRCCALSGAIPEEGAEPYPVEAIREQEDKT